MLQLFFIFIMVYVILQAAYSGYFLYQSKLLMKNNYNRKMTIGNSQKQSLKLFISGDSVADGVGSTTFETSVAGRVANYYAQKHYVHLENQAVSGAKMHDLVSFSKPATKQDVLVLIISSNDLFTFTSFVAFQNSTRQVLKIYAPLSQKIVLVGPGRVQDGKALPFFIRPIYHYLSHKYVRILKTESMNYPNLSYIDPIDIDFYHGFSGNALAEDKFHPNDQGHKLWFNAIKPAL